MRRISGRFAQIGAEQHAGLRRRRFFARPARVARSVWRRKLGHTEPSDREA